MESLLNTSPVTNDILTSDLDFDLSLPDLEVENFSDLDLILANLSSPSRSGLSRSNNSSYIYDITIKLMFSNVNSDPYQVCQSSIIIIILQDLALLKSQSH